jgi:uncharacterized membrane protein
MLGVSILKGMLSWVPVLNILTNFGLGLLLHGLWWLTMLLWVWLMIMAWIRPDYRLPYISQWVRYFV